MLASEALCGMAQMKLLPRAFSHLNAYSAPTACLFTTGAMVQLLTIVMMFSSEAYQLAYSLCTAAITISWTLAAAYMVKLGIEQRREGRAATAGSGGRREGVRRIALAPSCFTVVFLIVAVLVSGVEQLMLCYIAYVPGIVFHLMARREQGLSRLSAREKILATAIVAIALLSAAPIITELASIH